MSDCQVVFVTAPDQDTAQQIAGALVEESLAACVNILPGITSVYRWEGRVCKDAEFLLIIKSTAELFERLRSRVRQVHPYEVPEIIAIPIAAADNAYAEWIRAVTS